MSFIFHKRLEWSIRRIPTVMALAAVVTAFAVPDAVAQQRINFDELTTTGPGQGGKRAVFSDYAARGVTFNGPVAIDYSKGLAIPGFAHSGTIAIEQCYGKEFCSTPIQVNFTAGQAFVRLWIGSSQGLNANRVVKVRAFNVSGLLIALKQTTLPRSTTPVRINNPVEFALAAPLIRRVTVSYEDPPAVYNNGLAVDDVEFSSVGPPPPCGATGVPVIHRLEPPLYQSLQVNKFLLQGSVDGGGGMLSSAVVGVTSESGATKSLNVLGGMINPAGGSYGSWIYDMLFPGKNTVQLTATNCRGSSASAVVALYQALDSRTRFELLHVEVTQATQTMKNDVPLVAGKPTVVRAYLKVSGQTAPVLRVGGVLIARRVDGTPAPGPVSVAAMATGVVTSNGDVAAKRLDLEQSLNFRLPDEWIRAGRLHVEVARLEIDGDPSPYPCDRCDNNASNGLPALVTFAASRRLNLVLAPYMFARPGAPRPEMAKTVAGVLQWVNNAYPLAGSFPGDPAGINLIAILPLNSTTRELDAMDDETRWKEQAKFLKDLSTVFGKWRLANPDQPGDTRLLAIAPCNCGGMARLSGNVAFGSTNAVTAGGPSNSSFGRFGANWAHELGHTFSRRHSGADADEDDVDENFPDPDGQIGEPGLAITTEWWRGNLFVFDPDTVDIMGYGAPRWMSPYTYGALRARLRATTQLTRQTVEETLLVSGTISTNWSVTLDAGSRTTTATTGTGSAGEFTLRLLDATGQALLSYRFDGVTNSHDSSGDRSFSEFVPWRAGTRRIVVERDGVELAARDVSPNAPSVTILSPIAGDVATDTLDINWTGSDADSDLLTYSVLVNTGNGVWMPVATELHATSFTLDTSLLPETSKAQVRVHASDGVNSAEATSGTFTIARSRP